MNNIPMQKYLIIVAYDGTDYYGWQFQQKLPSIIHTLQHTFHQVFGVPIKITGASRTDAGVHAQGQIAIFKTDLVIDLDKMLFAWNNRLPADIVIRSLTKAPDNFHPFYNVERKIYHYHLFVEQPSPFIQRFGLYYQKKIDITLLQKALNIFVGTHDFTAFCAADVQSPTKIRTIQHIAVEYVPEWHAYRITIIGSSFLRYMIRRIVGAAIHVASSTNVTIDYLQELLHTKNIHNALPTAPAKGLTLHAVVYKQGIIHE